MSRVERKEYMESRTSRTTTPTRMKGSNPNLSQFDNNLDNLLEDLQSTVSRPGSALALQNGHVRESSRSYNMNSRSNSLNRANEPIEYNTDDVYSYTSPDGSKNVKTTRKETYSYRTGGIQRGDLPPERVRMQNNINQLDSLLDDLQQVKQNGTMYNVGNQFGSSDPGYQSFSQNKSMSEKRIIERDISGYPQTIEIIERPVRDDPDAAIAEFEEYKHRDYNKEMTSTSSSRSVPALKTSSLNRSTNTKMSNIQQYPIEVVETTSHDINPEILANLDPELLPSGNTKVTTTIKTYTYEIPGGANPSDIISPNATILSSAHSTPSKSFVYNSAANSNYTSSQTSNVLSQRKQPQQPPSPKMSNKYQQQDNRLVQQETVTTRNYQPTNIVYEDNSNPNKRTYIYNETTLTRNPVTTPMPAEKPYSPPHTPSSHQPRNEIRHHVTTHESRSRSSDHQQQQHTTNVTNVHHHHHHQNRSSSSGRHSPYLNGIEPDYNVSEIIETFEAQSHSGGGGGSAPSTPGAAGKPYPAGFIYPTQQSSPPSPVTPPSTPKAQRKPALPITAGANQTPPSTQTTIYKTYTSNTSSASNQNASGTPSGGGGNYRSTKNSYYYNPNAIDPQAYPRRFPTDENDNAPPRDVQVLMKNIGAEPPTSPLNAGYIAHEQEMVQQKKIEQMKHQKEMEEQRKPEYYKDVQKSRNVTGTPVYYPPGHEMFAKKEESGGWRAEGAMAKESGKYKYEAEAKSKSKSSSGAAIVPVCLPLCCGLPCTIL